MYIELFFCVDKTCEFKQLLVDIQFMLTELSRSPLYGLIFHARLNVAVFCFLETFNNLGIAVGAVSSPCSCYLHATPSNHN